MCRRRSRYVGWRSNNLDRSLVIFTRIRLRNKWALIRAIDKRLSLNTTEKRRAELPKSNAPAKVVQTPQITLHETHGYIRQSKPARVTPHASREQRSRAGSESTGQARTQSRRGRSPPSSLDSRNNEVRGKILRQIFDWKRLKLPRFYSMYQKNCFLDVISVLQDSLCFKITVPLRVIAHLMASSRTGLS